MSLEAIERSMVPMEIRGARGGRLDDRARFHGRNAQQGAGTPNTTQQFPNSFRAMANSSAARAAVRRSDPSSRLLRTPALGYRTLRWSYFRKVYTSAGTGKQLPSLNIEPHYYSPARDCAVPRIVRFPAEEAGAISSSFSPRMSVRRDAATELAACDSLLRMAYALVRLAHYKLEQIEVDLHATAGSGPAHLLKSRRTVLNVAVHVGDRHELHPHLQ